MGLLFLDYLTKNISVLPLYLLMTQKNRDLVSYEDTFIIKYSENIILVIDSNKGNLLKLHNNFKNIINNKNIFYTFRFENRMTGYYCENKECNKIHIKDTKQMVLKVVTKVK